MRIILASGSPRRRELLAMAGFSFEVLPSDVDETADPKLPADELVALLSERKALHLNDMLKDDSTVIIAADTVVAIDGLILGKPADEDDAFNKLSRLQGRPHMVFTGVTLLSRKRHETFVESSKVFMRKLNEKEIRDYIATGEPADKAGAYAIQGLGSMLIEKLEGDFYTIVGLPLCRLNLALRDFMSL